MKKKQILIVLLAVFLVLIILGVSIKGLWHEENLVQYTNFFEYAVDISNEEYYNEPIN